MPLMELMSMGQSEAFKFSPRFVSHNGKTYDVTTTAGQQAIRSFIKTIRDYGTALREPVGKKERSKQKPIMHRVQK